MMKNAQHSQKNELIKIFISYCHVDEDYRKALNTHLISLKRQNLIDIWHDREIRPGKVWSKLIDKNSSNADIILLLISADFIASPYCYEIEVQHALQQHQENKSIVIPIILRPCNWQSLPFAKLQAATPDGKPVTAYPSQDEAFAVISKKLQTIVEDLLKKKKKDRELEKDFTPLNLPLLDLDTTNSEILSLSFNNLHAKGYVHQDGFILQKGSQLSLIENPEIFFSNYKEPNRKNMIKKQHKKKEFQQKGFLIEREGFYEVTQDILVSSPSYAATLVGTSPKNGYDCWKNNEGKTINQLMIN